MKASNLAAMLRAPAQQISREDWEKLRPQVAGEIRMDANPDGSLVEWDPKEKAITRNPTPPLLDRTGRDWGQARHDASDHQCIVIAGAGESLLTQDLRCLSTVPVMGINWTRKWFEPTYLHILDKQPFRKQVIECAYPGRAQLITCRSTFEWAKTLNYQDENVLSYEVKDDSCGKHPSFQLAEDGSDMFQAFPNSLGYALQAAVALGFRRIVLAGFDFGGAHFFGDGRKEGCFQHWGDAGIAKQYLRPMLMAQAHVLQLRGIRVAHVGPTTLRDCYPIVTTVEDALERVSE